MARMWSKGILAIVLIVGLAFVLGLSFTLAPLSSDIDITKIGVVPPIESSIGKKVTIPVTVHSETEGTFYVEAGIREQSRRPLAIVGSSSQCDGKTQYAGRFWWFVAGETETFDLILSDYGVEGIYDIVIGVYRGCSDDLAARGEQQIVYEEIVYPQGLIVRKTETQTQQTIITGSPDGVIQFGKVAPRSGTAYVLGKPVDVTGTFTASESGRYLLEAGLVPKSTQPFAIVTAERSVCDSRDDYASQFVNLAKGERTDFKFTVIPKSLGQTDVQIYATNGCAAALGSQFIFYDGPKAQIINVVNEGQPGTTSPPSTSTLDQCVTNGETKTVECSVTNPVSDGRLTYTCQSGVWVHSGGQCQVTSGTSFDLLPDQGQVCLGYQESVPGEGCKTNISLIFTNEGLTDFAKNRAGTLFIVLIIFGLGLVGVIRYGPMVAKNITKKMRRR